MRMNKRGQLQEISTFLVALFVISVFGLTMWKVGDGLSDALYNSPINTTDTTSAIEGLETVTKSGDTLFLGIFVFFMLILLISAWLLPTQPVFTALYLLGITVLWLLSIPLSNAYEKISQANGMSSAVADLGIIDTIMLNLPMVATVVVAMLLLVLFGKRYIGVE